MSKSFSVVFFGSGPVAAATLEGLLTAGFIFEAIITKDRVGGYRGPVPVLEAAKNHGIPFFTPSNKQELSALVAKHPFKSPVGLVVDYGIIIAKDVIQSFPKGIINSHFSLLPEWRGADPITFSVLSGQAVGGVSLMLINERLDEGQLIAQEQVPLASSVTTPQLTTQLITKSNSMLNRYLPKYVDGDINPYPQPSIPPTYSRKLSKADGLLDLKKTAQQLEREVRAFQGWPKSAVTLFSKYPVIVKEARVVNEELPGMLVLHCANNSLLEITKLTAPSGRTMDGRDFLRGHRP